jgi:glyoxylase-like metal-dependent hydrolase (beta-lactamase superfamily II)
MIIRRFVNSIFTSNCYIIIQQKSENVIIVDPGDSHLTDLKDYLTTNNYIVEYVIFTHEHYDHIAGGKLLKDLYGCKFIASKECADAMVNPKKNLSIFYDNKLYFSPEIDLTVEDLNYFLDWNSLQIKFMMTPGHTKGSICFCVENYIFTGDTLINNTKTVTNLPGGSKISLVKSLELIKSYCNISTILLPGHDDRFRFGNGDFSKILSL